MKAIKSNMIHETGLPSRARRVMLCEACDSEFSANAGDYFQLPDDHVFQCAHCGSDRMELLYKSHEITYSEEPIHKGDPDETT